MHEVSVMYWYTCMYFVSSIHSSSFQMSQSASDNWSLQNGSEPTKIELVVFYKRKLVLRPLRFMSLFFICKCFRAVGQFFVPYQKENLAFLGKGRRTPKPTWAASLLRLRWRDFRRGRRIRLRILSSLSQIENILQCNRAEAYTTKREFGIRTRLGEGSVSIRRAGLCVTWRDNLLTQRSHPYYLLSDFCNCNTSLSTSVFYTWISNFNLRSLVS